MDQTKLLEKLIRIIRELKKKGEFSLVMVIPTSNDVDSKLNLIISAPWLDKNDNAYELIVDYLRKYLDNEEFSYMARVTIINSIDEFVRKINSMYRVKEDIVNLENISIMGTQIDKAILLESSRLITVQ